MDLELTNQGNTYEHTETVKAILQNENKAIEKLYIAIFPKVKIYILQNKGNEDQAKDIFQEAFLDLWRNIKDGKFSPGQDENIEAYLYTIAKNKWIDHLRSARYQKKTSLGELTELIEASNEWDKVTEEASYNEMASVAREAVNRLGKTCNRLLKLFYFERKSMKVISKQLKITTASARNKKYRCMQQLRKFVIEYQINGHE